MQEQPSGLATTVPAKTRVPWWRRRLLLTLIAFTMLLLSAPWIAGSRWIVNPMLAQVIPADFRASVQHVSLGWLRPIAIDGLRVEESGGEALAEIAQVKGEKALLALLVNRRDWGTIVVQQPQINLTLLDQGSNFQKLASALKPTTEQPTQSSKVGPLPIDFGIDVRGLRFMVSDGSRLKPLLDAPLGDFRIDYRAAAGPAFLQVTSSRLIHKTALTPELFAYGLDYVLPILANTAKVDGEISLEAENIVVPLNNVRETVAAGQLTIHHIIVGSDSPIVQKVGEVAATAFGRPIASRIVLADESKISFRVADQRVWHQGIKFGLPEIDPELVFTTSGYVHFDRQLDLILEIPLPIQWMARKAEIKELGIQPLRIPIRGSLDQPVIEWSTAGENLSSIIREIQNRLGEDAPIQAAFLKEAGAIASGESDALERASAALSLWQQLRDARGKLGEPQSVAQPESKSDEKESRPTIRQRLRERLLGRPQTGERPDK